MGRGKKEDIFSNSDQPEIFEDKIPHFPLHNLVQLLSKHHLYQEDQIYLYVHSQLLQRTF